jgi:16S rRNA (guanine966-N2)-methyltransferase
MSQPIISGGTRRGVKLEVPTGRSTRPTRTRVRASIFDLIGGRVRGAEVLDLYAGSGALGLEALSRGAARCTFVENDPRALSALRRNIEACRLQEGQALVLRVDAQRWEPGPGDHFGVVLADPPFALLDPLPPALGRPGVLEPGGLLVIETPAERLAPRCPEGLVLTDRRRYGRSAICLMASQPES